MNLKNKDTSLLCRKSCFRYKLKNIYIVIHKISFKHFAIWCFLKMLGTFMKVAVCLRWAIMLHVLWIVIVPYVNFTRIHQKCECIIVCCFLKTFRNAINFDIVLYLEHVHCIICTQRRELIKTTKYVLLSTFWLL